MAIPMHMHMAPPSPPAAGAARPRSTSCVDPAPAIEHPRAMHTHTCPPAGRDELYGYGPLAHLCENVILALFACPPASHTTGRPRAGTHPTPPPVRLVEFIAYALYRVRLPAWVVYHALYLLRRLKSRFPFSRGSSGHRLFISSLMLASKTVCDDTYSNRSWTIVAQGFFSLPDINTMETELFAFLGYHVNIPAPQLAAFASLLERGDLPTALLHPTSVPAPPPATPIPPPHPHLLPHGTGSGTGSTNQSSPSHSGSGSGSTAPSSVPDSEPEYQRAPC